MVDRHTPRVCCFTFEGDAHEPGCVANLAAMPYGKDRIGMPEAVAPFSAHHAPDVVGERHGALAPRKDVCPECDVPNGFHTHICSKRPTALVHRPPNPDARPAPITGPAEAPEAPWVKGLLYTAEMEGPFPVASSGLITTALTPDQLVTVLRAEAETLAELLQPPQANQPATTKLEVLTAIAELHRLAEALPELLPR